MELPIEIWQEILDKCDDISKVNLIQPCKQFNKNLKLKLSKSKYKIIALRQTFNLIIKTCCLHEFSRQNATDIFYKYMDIMAVVKAKKIIYRGLIRTVMYKGFLNFAAYIILNDFVKANILFNVDIAIFRRCYRTYGKTVFMEEPVELNCLSL